MFRFFGVRVNHRTLVFIGGAYSALACAEAEDRRLREAATARVMGALKAELEAAVCFGPNRTVDTLPNTFFPDVVLVRGTCPKEHSGSASRVAGIDREGVVYTLDSEGAFYWLLSRHTPKNLDSAQVVEYAYLALRLMGRADARAELIDDVADLPPEVRSALSPENVREFPAGVIEIGSEAAEAWVATYDGERLVAHQVFLSLPEGGVDGFTHVMWTAPRPF